MGLTRFGAIAGLNTSVTDHDRLYDGLWSLVMKVRTPDRTLFAGRLDRLTR
jgi:hypothetical protein